MLTPWRAFPILLTASHVLAATLSVRIVDEHSNPVPARVYLSGASGPVLPGGTLVYKKVRPDGIAEQHFVPPAGVFEVSLPDGSYRLTIERGKEYLPYTETLTIRATNLARTIALQRWVSMANRGWYSADMHLHRRLADVAVLMESEDLNMALPISRWRRISGAIEEDEDLRQFLERAGPDGSVRAGPRRTFLVLNEELEPRDSALLTSNLGKKGTELLYPMAQYGRSARDRKALVDSEKATSLELPVIAALGGCDTVGLTNNHFWRSGHYAGAWGAWPAHTPSALPETCQGYAQAGFELYAALLNAGFPLKPSAGSANGVHPVPPGWSRIYAKPRGGFDAASWLEAVRAGRSFATTGPMLLLNVNGLEPGAEHRRTTAPLKLQATVRMLSPAPVEEAELTINGKPHEVRLHRKAKHEYAGTFEATIQSTAWVAARWIGARGGACDAAHTGPIFFRLKEEPVPADRAALEYLRGRVSALLQQAESGTGPDGKPTSVEVRDPAVRWATLDAMRRALQVYVKKLEQQN